MRSARSMPVVDVLRGVDPAWLFLLAGLAVIGATVTIAAQDDLDHAMHRRDRALAMERQHVQRVDRYSVFLDALERRDESVVRSMLALQRNETTMGRVSIDDLRWSEPHDASILPLLEPDPVRVRSEPPEQASLLGRLATGERSRLWLLAAGALFVLCGLLPPTVRIRPE